MVDVNANQVRRAAENLGAGLDPTGTIGLPKQNTEFAARLEGAMFDCAIPIPEGASGNIDALLKAAKTSLIESARLVEQQPGQSEAILRNMATFLHRMNDLGSSRWVGDLSEAFASLPQRNLPDFGEPRSQVVTDKVKKGPNVLVQVTIGRRDSSFESQVDEAAAGPTARQLDPSHSNERGQRLGRFVLVIDYDRSCEKLHGLLGDRLGAWEYHPGSSRNGVSEFENFVAARVRDQLREGLYTAPNQEAVAGLTGIVRVNLSGMPWMANLQTRDLPDRIVSQIRDSAGIGINQVLGTDFSSRAA